MNFVPLERMTDFLNNTEMDKARPFYEQFYNMKKVLMMLPVLEKTLIHKLKRPATETCMYIALANWEKVIERVIFLFTFLDRAPP